MLRLLILALPVTMAAALPCQASTCAPVPIVSANTADESPRVTVQTGTGGFALLTFGAWPAPQSDRHSRHDQLIAEPKNPAPSTRDKDASFRRTLYLPHVRTADQHYALPSGLLDAMIWAESRYNPFALSKAGAAGLGQLMSGTARQLGVRNRLDLVANVWGAARYLRTMLDRFGRVYLAIAACNAGPVAIDRLGRIPMNVETPGYVREVLGSWH